MTPFGSEVISGLSVLATVTVCCSLFPVEGLGFHAAAGADPDPAVAFVTLDPDVEAAALQATKTAIRRQCAEGRRYAELVFAELPEAEQTDVRTYEDRARPPVLPLVTSGRSAYLPSQRASAPARIVPQEPKSDLPFPREELLNLDTKGL